MEDIDDHQAEQSMNPFPPFSSRPAPGRRVCPKCNESSLWTVRHVGGSVVMSSIGSDDRREQWDHEHLVWSCPRCGYSIKTQTADTR